MTGSGISEIVLRNPTALHRLVIEVTELAIDTAVYVDGKRKWCLQSTASSSRPSQQKIAMAALRVGTTLAPRVFRDPGDKMIDRCRRKSDNQSVGAAPGDSNVLLTGGIVPV